MTVPAVFTLATKASVVAKRIAASGMESAFSSVTVTLRRPFPAPASNASDAGLTAMVSGVNTTCASTSASSDALVAVISDVPVPPTEVSSPSSSTVRIAPSLDANATDSPSTARPFASTTVTVSWSVSAHRHTRLIGGNDDLGGSAWPRVVATGEEDRRDEQRGYPGG